MIKIPNDVLREFPIIWKTDRDIENPLLIEFLQKLVPIDSLLDVGSAMSGRDDRYAKKIRPFIKRYDGVDIVADRETSRILDHYITGNFLEMMSITPDDPFYDVVISVSVLEHCGVSTYKADPKKERIKVFTRCLQLAKKYAWISFDCGQEYTYPNELSIVTGSELENFEQIAKDLGFTFKKRFFYNQGPQASHPWYEHAKQDVAFKIPYIDYIGNQSVTVLEIEKERKVMPNVENPL